MPIDKFVIEKPHADIELGYAREPFSVHYAAPAAGVTEETGVIVHMCEFGVRPDAGAVAEKLLPSLADKYNCVAISPSYFGVYRRDKVDITASFIHNLNRIYNMKFTRESFASLPSVNDAFLMIAKAVAERGVTSVDNRCQPLMVTGRGEYQSWGFLPAIDGLTALGETLKRFEQVDTRKIVALGQYYGGYVASLMGKYAPGVFSAVVNKSGYSRVETRHILCGETLESDMDVSYKINGKNEYGFTLSLCGNNPWTIMDETKNSYFSDACRSIRSMLERSHFSETETSFLYFSDRGDAEYINNMGKQADILAEVANVVYEKLEKFEDKGAETLEGLMSYAYDRYSDRFVRESKETDFSTRKTRSFGCGAKTYTFEFGDERPLSVRVE